MNETPTKSFAVDQDKPTDWFEDLYAQSNIEGRGVPWANMSTHPLFVKWLKEHALPQKGKKAIVVGCGLGDDAIELASRGFDVTAFDVSHTAIDLCKQRFPNHNINFVQADLLKDQNQWVEQFDFVLEIYTVQALPPKFENLLWKNITDFVANNGQLLVIAEVSKEERDFEKGPPWLLTPNHIDIIKEKGFKLESQDIQQGELDSKTFSYTSQLTRRA